MPTNGIKRPLFKPAAMAMVGLALASLMACADTKPRNFSGFLGDYSALKQVPGAKVDFLYRKPGANLANYDSIMFDPVAIYYHPQSRLLSFDHKDIVRLAVYFQDALANAVKDTYPVVVRPGPNTLRVRGAITNLKVSRPLSGITSPELMKFSLFTGDAWIEAEFLDSVTNQRLVAIVDARKAGGAGNPNYFRHWSEVRTAFREWAQRFRARLDFLPGKNNRPGKK